METKLKVISVSFFLKMERLLYKIHALCKNSAYTKVHKKQKWKSFLTPTPQR